MKKLFFVALPIAFILSSCKPSGQNVSSPARTTSFPISLTKKQVPSSLRQTFSSPARGQLTLSYTAPAGNGGKVVWLLLFERTIPSKQRPLNTRFKGYVGSKGPVTLLVVAPSPQKKWNLVRSIPLGVVSKLRQDYISLRWLEPAKSRGPVLIVHRLEGVGGSSGLIAFPNGWAQPNAGEQIFGDWMNYEQGAKYSFDAVDSSGFLSITETITDYGHNSLDSAHDNYYLWNGNNWQKPH